MYTFLTSIVSLALILIRVIRCQYYVLLPPNHTNSTADVDVVSSNHFDDVDSILHYRHHTFDHSHPPPPYPGCDSDHTAVVFALGVITVLFFLFTFCMLIEQTEAISTNMSKIARMKTRGGMISHPNEYAPIATVSECEQRTHRDPLPSFFPHHHRGVRLLTGVCVCIISSGIQRGIRRRASHDELALGVAPTREIPRVGRGQYNGIRILLR